MTLTSAIEAAKDALKDIWGISLSPTGFSKVDEGAFLSIKRISEEVLAALPEPKTESEIIKIAHAAATCGSLANTENIIRALRDHDVLFVKE